MYKKKPQHAPGTNEQKASRLVGALLSNPERMQKYGTLIKYIKEKLDSGALGMNGWGFEFSRLSRIADNTWELEKKKIGVQTPPFSSDASSVTPSSHGNWESSMQYVKSMMCDPAQYEKLYSSASWDDKDALAGLKREFDKAKASGKKVEKRPEEWARAKDLVDCAKLGKKPQQQRSQFYQEPKAEPARATADAAAKMESDIRDLLKSEFLGADWRSKLESVLPMANAIVSNNRAEWESLISQLKQEVKEKAKQKTGASLLDRCNALLKSGKLKVEECDDMQRLKSDIEMDVKIANARQALEQMEKKAASRQAMNDAHSAFKTLLAPENAKFMEFETLERVERTFADRDRLASDWVQDRVSDAYLEFSENKQLGRVVNGAEKPENKALIARIDAVLAANVIVGEENKTELEYYKNSLQRNGLGNEYMRMLEKLLKQGEAKININKAAGRALALDGLSDGEKSMILRMSGAQPGQGKAKPLSARLERDRQQMSDLQKSLTNGAQNGSDAGKPTLNDGTLVHTPLFLLGRMEKLQEAMAKIDLKKANGVEKLVLEEIKRSLGNYIEDLRDGLDLRLLPKYVGAFNNIETRIKPIIAKQGIEYGGQNIPSAQREDGMKEVMTIHIAVGKLQGMIDGLPFDTTVNEDISARQAEALLQKLDFNMATGHGDLSPESLKKRLAEAEALVMPIFARFEIPYAQFVTTMDKAESKWVQTGTPESFYYRALAVLEAGVMGHNDKIELEIFRNQLGSGSLPSYDRLKLLNGLLAEGEGLMRTAGPSVTPQALMNKADELRQALTTALLDSDNNINNKKMRAIRERVDSLKTQLWGNVQNSDMPGLIERFLANQKEASAYLDLYEVDYAPLKVGKASEAVRAEAPAQASKEVLALAKAMFSYEVLPAEAMQINLIISRAEKGASLPSDMKSLERIVHEQMEREAEVKQAPAAAVETVLSWQFNRRISDLQIALMEVGDIDVHEDDDRLEQAYHQLTDLRSHRKNNVHMPASEINALSRIEERMRPVLKEYGLAVGEDGQILNVPAEPITSSEQMVEKAQELNRALALARVNTDIELRRPIDGIMSGVYDLMEEWRYGEPSSSFKDALKTFRRLEADAAQYLEKYGQAAHENGAVSEPQHIQPTFEQVKSSDSECLALADQLRTLYVHVPGSDKLWIAANIRDIERGRFDKQDFHRLEKIIKDGKEALLYAQKNDHSGKW